MALFRSSEDRRIERDIKIRQGIRQIERSIREQAKFQDEFIRNAQRARAIGDDAQYKFIRSALKKTATVKRMLERQLLAVRNALLIKRQAEANATFAQSMGLMAREIGKLFGQTDLARTQAEWEKAMAQSQTMEERMGLFLESVQDMAAHDTESAEKELTDQDIDRLIETEAQAEQQQELGRIRELRAELAAIKGEQAREGK